MKKIAIFASGSGTNAENIVKYFANSETVKVELILSNSSKAYVLERAKKLQVKSCVFNKDDFRNGKVLEILKANKIDFVVLAGFLWLVPSEIIDAFPNKIVNIHPALLPKFGGKGMYGDNVHKAVITEKETESGITIHYVNEHYDEGNIIFQVKCQIDKNDTAEMLAQKIHELEYEHFPEIINKVVHL